MTDTALKPLPTETELRGALARALGTVGDHRRAFTHVFPDDTTRAGRYPARASNVGWTTGFSTGLFWLAYEHTGDPAFRESAEAHVASFAERLALRADVGHHDLGFLYTLSCVAAWRLTGNPQARAAALEAAELLHARFLPRAGIIQAWGDLNDPRQRGRMIVDCLMNLPLLHWAAREGGEARYREAAISHARQAARFLVRGDHSTHHTFYFDPETGTPLHGRTHQGHTDDSTWSRGQAWGVYGFALNAALAGDDGLLRVACRVADHYLERLPADLVPYWDFHFREPSPEPRDSSAAAIAACGLLALAEQLPAGQGERYREWGLATLGSLARAYTPGEEDGSDALLLHGVYSRPENVGVDEGTLWGDYFYLEALTRATRAWTPYW